MVTHDVVAQKLGPMEADTLKSVEAKLKPDMVTVPPALVGMFLVPYVTDGASYVNALSIVPRRLETVSPTSCSVLDPYDELRQ